MRLSVLVLDAVLVVNELRSHSVHKAFMEAFTPTHTIKVIPHSKMDDVYQHPNIQVWETRIHQAGAAQHAACHVMIWAPHSSCLSLCA